MADRTVALFNLRRGLAELEGYTALPVEHPRDKAGMIQGFEFTFELFWKTFQKLLDRLLHRYLPCFRAAMARVQAEIETEGTTLK